ncbi:MAG: hypothetical protein U0T83_03560 [Bacteriovoracaceae bacterium]
MNKMIFVIGLSSILASSVSFAKKIDFDLTPEEFTTLSSKLKKVEVKNKIEFEVDTEKKDLKTNNVDLEYVVKKKKAEIKIKDKMQAGVKRSAECLIVNRQVIDDLASNPAKISSVSPVQCKVSFNALHPLTVLKSILTKLNVPGSDLKFVKKTDIESNIYNVTIENTEYEMDLAKKVSEKKIKYKVELELEEGADKDSIEPLFIEFLKSLGVQK